MDYIKEMFVIIVFTLAWPVAFSSSGGSSTDEEACEQKLRNCTAQMRPLVSEVRHVFPISQQEIEGMCQVWSSIVECVRRYVSECSSEEQRLRFNDAASGSVDAVHAICSSDRYRRDYLEYANCYRKVSMDSCAHHFRKMVDSAYNPYSPEKHICCAYREYEKCVSDPIQRLCGPQALHILDDSMSSLRTRCDTLYRSLKPSDKICPADVTLQDTNDYTVQGPSFRHVDGHAGAGPTFEYLSNAPPSTTPAWAQRTVIYPLEPARRHARVQRGGATGLGPALSGAALATAACAALWLY